MFNAVNRPYQYQLFGIFYQLKRCNGKHKYFESQIEMDNNEFGKSSQLLHNDIVEQMCPQLNQKTIKNIFEKIRPSNKTEVVNQNNHHESKENKLSISSNNYNLGRKKKSHVEMNSFEQYNPRGRLIEKPLTRSYRDSTYTFNNRDLKTTSSNGNILNGKSVLNHKENKLLNQLKKEHAIKFKRGSFKDLSCSNANYNSHYKNNIDMLPKKEEETKIIYNRKIAYLSGTSHFLENI